MNDLLIWCLPLLGLLGLGGCAEDDHPTTGQTGHAREDAAVSETAPGSNDAGAEEPAAGCRPAGSPCATPADMLSCCSRRCSPDEATQSGVCR